MFGKTFLLLFIIVTVVFSQIADTTSKTHHKSRQKSHKKVSYCEMPSCKHKKAKHSMCLFNTTTPASRCGKYTKVPLSKSEIKYIVDRHNYLRQYVAAGKETQGNPGPQPAAKHMPLLKWDRELARIAQRYADQCIHGHDKCRDVARFTVGQNIATTWGKDSAVHPSLKQHMHGWYREVSLFNKEYVKKYKFEEAYGHYTQMLWAKTTLIGCGRVRFTVGKTTTLRLICNYGPHGNVIGQPMYEIA